MDETEDKNSKILGIFIIVVVILFIVIFVYKKITNPDIKKEKEKKNPVDNTTEVDNTPKEDVDDWTKLEEFPKNDKSVEIVALRYEAYETEGCNYSECEDIYVYENVKDYKVLAGNIDVIFNCTNSKKSDECGNISFTIDKKIKYLNEKFDIDHAYMHIIYKTKDNYIIKEVGTEFGEGTIYVYDKVGNLIQTYDDTVTKFNRINDKVVDDITYEYDPVISDNYLYFVYRSGEVDFTNGLDSEIKFTRVNLSNLEYDNLYTIKALTYDLP